MKKLMFALIAGVAVSAVHAAPITQSDFETGEFTAGATVGESTVGEAPATLTRFAYVPSSSSENGSTVKAYGSGEGEVSAFDGTRNSAFSGANAQYLDLSTDGGTLYRTISGRDADHLLGTEQAVTSALYIDTLVQFTVCDSAPEIDNSAKLAIWLQASDDETTTNLMVRAKTYAVGGVASEETFTGVVTNFAIGAAGTYQAGTWYRLTVEAVPNVFTSTKGAAGFKIRINGSYVKAASGAAFTGSTALVENMVADYNGLINANAAEATIFLPLNGSVIAASSFESNPLTLSAVGFSGTGLVDDILFTADNPFFTAPTTLDFTLTLAENVSSVTYSINGADGVTVNTTTIVQAVPVGATIALSNIATASAEWQTFSASVAAGANATVAGTTVTLKAGAAFQPTDENLTTAGATVSAVANAPADDASVASFLEALGLNSTLAAKFTTVSDYGALMSWVADNNYTKTRINAYPYSYERLMQTKNLTGGPYPIEMEVFVGTNALVTGYASTVAGTPSTDAGTGDPDGAGVMYTVDAGVPFTLSDFTYVAPSANKEYKLDGDGTSANWKPDPSDEYSAVDGLTIAVDQATSNSVAFTTLLTAASAQVGIGVVEVDVAVVPTTIDFTLTLATGVSSVTFTLGEGSYTTNATAHFDLAAGTATITAVTYDDWYVAAGLAATSNFVVSSESTAATVGAEKADASEIINDNTTAADLGINNAAFAGDTSANLAKLAAWAQSQSPAVTISQVNAMSFSAGVPQDTTAEAYLLNCAPTAEAVAAAKAAFKFTSITPGTTPSISGDGYNGTVTVEGKAALSDATWGAVDANTRFYRATLTK